MLKVFVSLFLLLIRSGFSSGSYCIFNNTTGKLLISVYPNGYSVAVLERNRTVNVPKMDSNPRKFRLKPNKGIIFETLRNYTHPGVAQLKILKGGNSPITLDLRIQYLKTETASQLSVKQDSSIQRLTEGINDAAAFMGYASQSHSTIVLSG